MRSFLAAIGFVLLAHAAQAQRNDWKPHDFQPLTQLPWTKGDLTQDQVIERIFHEPDAYIRYPVLSLYLRLIPEADLPRAFDLAVSLEGNQNPDSLVSFLLYIWAKRDPAAAWLKTQDLFKCVGIQEGWLGYDAWENERIDVQDWQVIQKSRFWIGEHVLESFGMGCKAADGDEQEKLRLLKKYENLFFEHFKSWPEDGSRTEYAGAWYADDSIQRVFEEPLESPAISFTGGDDQAKAEVHWRRWVEAHPDHFTELLQQIEMTQFPEQLHPKHRPAARAYVSTDLLMVWRRADRDGLIKWASAAAPPPGHEDAWFTAQCMLVAEVRPEQREKWLGTLLTGDHAMDNLRTLAAWEPQLAMEQAGRVKDEDMELSVLVDGCAFGPWGTFASNTTHFGLGYLDKHGLDHLAPELQKKLKEPGWFECYFMEQWGDVDVGEAARFGFRTMLQGNLVPRQELIEMYSGKNDGSTDDGIIDRTFCTLRVWAVVRPKEMAEWIEKQDKDMQESLRWLLKNPWGTGE